MSFNYGLIGNPVSHSKSPVIHNMFASYIGIDMTYDLFCVEENELGDFLHKGYEAKVKGYNVTVPHKSSVMKYLIGISDEAKAVGAVNTLKLSPNGYEGINTDTKGFLRCLRENGISVLDRECVVIGAGGAARAVIYSIIKAGAKRVFVVNRTKAHAEILCNDMNEVFSRNVCSYASAEEIVDISPGFFCAQTSSLGLKGEDAMITDETFYSKMSEAVDIVPKKTTDFIERCKASGKECSNGFDMLVYQAVESFEYWHDVHVPNEAVLTVRSLLNNE